MQQKISYWVDENNIIRKVDDCWDLTLEDPTARRVHSQEILGKSLFDFICDDVTQMYIRTLLQSVRLIPRTLHRSYRCDSPDEKRYMEMVIEFEDDDLVRVTHEIVRTEPIIPPVFFETVQPLHQANYHIRCSLCNQLRLAKRSYWQEVDTILEQLNQPLPVTYSVCTACIATLKNDRAT